MNGRSGVLSPRKLLERILHHLQSPPCFQDSVDEANCIDIDYTASWWWKSRYSCWEVAVRIAEEYKSLGMPIYTRTSGGELRRATANAVHAGTEYVYLSAAHAFSNTGPLVAPSVGTTSWFDFPFGTDSDSEDSDSASNIQNLIVEVEAICLNDRFCGLRDLPTTPSSDPHPQAELELLDSASISHEQLDFTVVILTNDQI